MPNPSGADLSANGTLRLRRSPGLGMTIMLAWLPLLILAWMTASGSLLGLGLLGCLALLGVSTALPWVRSSLKGMPGLRLQGNRLTSQGPGDTTVEWRPCRSSLLFSRVAWLELHPVVETRPKIGGAGHRRLLLTDLPGLANIHPDDFRQLRVWLRMGARYH